MKHIFSLCLICAALTGCTTAAQQQATKIDETFKKAGKEGMECDTAVYNKPEYAAIVSHIPLPLKTNKPTMSQLADDSYPTEEESKLLIQMHDDAIPCREAELKKIMSVAPDVANILANGWVEDDKITLKLVKRKITWGELNTQRQELTVEFLKKSALDIQQKKAELADLNQAELAQRKAQIQAIGSIANALVQWSACRHTGGSVANCIPQQQ